MTINQRAVDRAVGMLRHAAEPVEPERRREIAEAVVAALQSTEQVALVRVTQDYDFREPLRRGMWAEWSVTGPQVDGAIRAAALALSEAS